MEFDKRTKIPVLKFDRKMLKNSKTTFSFDPSNFTSIGENSFQEDLFEKKMVFVRQSSIPGAGNGLFLRFYN